MINGIVTAFLLTCFLAIAVWAYSRRNHERFKAAAQLPLHEDGACCCGNKACAKEGQP